jgi:hypothetical protein
MVASSLVFLPRDILAFIANYFLASEDQNKKIYVYRYDWRNFMNTSKELFGQWKKESQLIVLTFPQSETFYNSEEFRERIWKSMKNPRLQLDLIFNRFSPDLDNPLDVRSVTIDLKRLNGTRKIGLMSGFTDRCNIIPCENLDVEVISLSTVRIKDLSFLSNVKSVSYSADRSMLFGTKVDLAPLQHIQKGIISVRKCVNYHLLANLLSLELSDCMSVTDVSCFANIPDLTLCNCENVTDVSPLSRVSTLDLSDCKGITDVSSLRNVHTLVLDYCENVTDISGLENVYSLSFVSFSGTNVSGLKNVVILDISGSANVSDISMLHSVRDLTIENCPKMEGLTDLTNLKQLTIDNQNKITSGQGIIQQLVKLDMTIELAEDYDDWSIPKEIKPWENFDMLTTHPNLQHLVASGFNMLTKFPFMANLLSLELNRCNKLINLVFPALPLLESLKITDCFNLESVHLLGDSGLKFSLETFNLFFNEALAKVQIDRKVSRCHIDDCSGLEVIELHQQVGYLRCPLEDCLERIVNQSWIVCLSLQHSGGSDSQKPVLDQEKDELTFGIGVKRAKKERRSSIEEDEEEEEEENEGQEDSYFESGEDNDDENDDDSGADDQQGSDSAASEEDN